MRPTHPQPDDDADASRPEQLRDTFALLSPEELAALLNVDDRTLAFWRSKKRGPAAVKLGRAVFYRRADVAAWIAQNVASLGVNVTPK